MEDTGAPGENYWPVTYKLYSIMLYRIHLIWAGFEHITSVVIGTDYILYIFSLYDNCWHSVARRVLHYKQELFRRTWIHLQFGIRSIQMICGMVSRWQYNSHKGFVKRCTDDNNIYNNYLRDFVKRCTVQMTIIYTTIPTEIL